jgi:hypothetical protein
MKKDENNDIGKLYENFILNEIAGATNYWLSSDGELIKVEDHIDYAVKNFNTPFHIDPDEYIPMNSDGSIAEENDVYDAVFQMGYVRVVEDSANIYFTYSLSKKPNRNQFMTLYEFAQNKNKNLIDGETDKVIVKYNDVEPDVAGNAAVKKMDIDMQPSFYKNKRGNYWESVANSKSFDYTKLIYEKL